jgi:hypothetical protein
MQSAILRFYGLVSDRKGKFGLLKISYSKFSQLNKNTALIQLDLKVGRDDP